MQGERRYIVEFRQAGRGHRNSPVQRAEINAFGAKEAHELAKKHKLLKGMRILNISVDPKFWTESGKTGSKRKTPGKKRSAKNAA